MLKSATIRARWTRSLTIAAILALASPVLPFVARLHPSDRCSQVAAPTPNEENKR